MVLLAPINKTATTFSEQSVMGTTPGTVKSLGCTKFTECPAGTPIRRRAEKLSGSDIRCSIIKDGKQGGVDQSASHRRAFFSVCVHHATYSTAGNKKRQPIVKIKKMLWPFNLQYESELHRCLNTSVQRLQYATSLVPPLSAR